MLLSSATPDGLELIHTADSTAEAELLAQVLVEAEFHPEFVPSDRIGIFGVTGNDAIYVPATEAVAAREFLAQYLAAAPLAAEAGYTIDQQESQEAPTSDNRPALGHAETLRLGDESAPSSAAAGRPWYWWTALAIIAISVIAVILNYLTQ